MYALLEQEGDLALVVGGFNSSNTSHLVEIAEEKIPCFYIEGSAHISSTSEISHFDLHQKKVVSINNWLPEKRPVTILLSAGASSPDAQVERVIERVAELFGCQESLEHFKGGILAA